MTRLPAEPTFRALARSDLSTLQRWLNTPHVYEWWGRHSGTGSLGGAGAAAATAAEIEAKYGPSIDRGGTTHRFIIEHDRAAIGLIQWYHFRDFADYARAVGESADRTAGIDVLIGEPGALHRGLGCRAIDQFLRTIVFQAADVSRVVAGPAKTNTRSIRTFEKAGFRFARFASVAGEPVPEAVMVRDR